MKTLKSIWAIFVGFITVLILSLLTDYIIGFLGIFPVMTTFSLITAFIYRSIYTIVGGYVVAALAPNKPMRHVVILGIIGTILAVIGVVVGWSIGAHWYPILLAATTFAFTHLGGRVRVRIKTL